MAVGWRTKVVLAKGVKLQVEAVEAAEAAGSGRGACGCLAVRLVSRGVPHGIGVIVDFSRGLCGACICARAQGAPEAVSQCQGCGSRIGEPAAWTRGLFVLMVMWLAVVGEWWGEEYGGGGCGALCHRRRNADKSMATRVQMKERSMAKSLKGTVKEMLGTAFSVGCTVNGKSPKDLCDDIDEGTVTIPEK